MLALISACGWWRDGASTTRGVVVKRFDFATGQFVFEPRSKGPLRPKWHTKPLANHPKHAGQCNVIEPFVTEHRAAQL